MSEFSVQMKVLGRLSLQLILLVTNQHAPLYIWKVSFDICLSFALMLWFSLRAKYGGHTVERAFGVDRSLGLSDRLKRVA